MAARRVLGVDPSIANCGVAVIAGMRLLHAVTLRPPGGWSDEARVAWVGASLGRMIAEYAVDVVGVEAQHVGACRGNSIIKLCLAAGAAIAAAGIAGVPVVCVQPSEARRALGCGALRRHEVNRIVQRCLGLNAPLSEHQSAAAAVAMVARTRYRVARARRISPAQHCCEGNPDAGRGADG